MKLKYSAILEVKETLIPKYLILNLHAKDSIEDINQYMEGYQVILWDHAFPSFFRKDANYSSLIPFGENEGTKDVIKRLVYRYTCNPNCLSWYLSLIPTWIEISILQNPNCT